MNKTYTPPWLMISTLTVLIFLNLTIYLPSAKIFPFPAYLLDISIFIFILGYYLKKRLTFPIQNQLFLWLLYFILLNIIYYIFSSGGFQEFSLLKIIIFLTFVYIYQILLFSLDDENLKNVRTTLVFIAPIATISLGIDYFNPGYFTVDPSYMVIEGRAAAFYRNANFAGTSMIVLLILGIDMVSRQYRLLFVMVIFLGLFFTMSRSGLITFFIIILVMLFQKKLYVKQMLITLLLISTFFIWLATGGLDTMSQKYNLTVTENMKSRVNFFADNKDSDTSDMNERKEILHDALKMFQEEPLVGNGLGATLFWNHPVGPHNTFALVAAEQGIFGLFLILFLFFTATSDIFKYGTKEQKQLATLFILSYTISCFFSHEKLAQVTAIGFVVTLSTIGYKMKKIAKKDNI